MIDKTLEFNKLSWKLLEAKFRYYILDQPELQDHEYDALERRYDTLAKELGLEPTAANMVGFKEDSPSASLVRQKVMQSENPGGAKTYCECGRCEYSRPHEPRGFN